MKVPKGYKFSKNAFTKVVKDNPKDRIEVEIGDSKDSSKLRPQVKIMRWDNEVNASFRLIDDEPKTLQTKGEKIKLIGAKKEVHFYKIPFDEIGKGGFEFEVILKEKPITNKIEFSIETKGLNFYYQPELTQKEKNEGAFRPENVVGSYAVYHNGNPINYEGGKLYRAGKAFHIYRPKIIDSVGKWVWGELNIDIEKKLLTVTISQDFLDTAVYPVRHATGLKFGYETAGSSTIILCGDEINDLSSNRGTTYTPASTGTVDSLHACTGGTEAANIICAIYEEDSEAANSHGRTCVSAQVEAGTTYQYNTYIVAGSFSITGSIAYILSAWPQESVAKWSEHKIKYDSDSPNYYGQSVSPPVAPPDPWNLTETGTGRNYSIYCTYEAGGGPSGKRRYYSPGIWHTVGALILFLKKLTNHF